MSIDMIQGVLVGVSVALLIAAVLVHGCFYSSKPGRASLRLFVVMTALFLGYTTTGCASAPTHADPNSMVSEEDIKLVTEYLKGTKHEPVSVPVYELPQPTIKLGSK